MTQTKTKQYSLSELIAHHKAMIASVESDLESGRAFREKNARKYLAKLKEEYRDLCEQIHSIEPRGC